MWGGRGIAPLILGTKRKWMINFASPPLYFRESSPIPVGKRVGGQTAGLDYFEKRKIT